MTRSGRYLWLMLLVCLPCAWADDISLMAIMGSRASLLIGNKPLTLSLGESRHDVKLLALAEDSVTVEMAGKTQVLRLGQGVYRSSASLPDGGAAQKASVFGDGQGHFYANISAGGASVRGVIDTGATYLSISQMDAQHLGIRYDKGTPVSMQTAQGIMRAYLVKAIELRLEGIPLYNIDVVVSPGSFPTMPLIGMSILNHLDTRREGGTMMLTKKF